MTLKSQLSSDLPVFFNTDDFAETVTYNSVDIPAIVDYGADNSGENARTAKLIVKKSDVAAPAYRDTVVIDSITWRVFRDSNKEVAVAGAGYVWEIGLIRDEKPMFR